MKGIQGIPFIPKNEMCTQKLGLTEGQKIMGKKLRLRGKEQDINGKIKNDWK